MDEGRLEADHGKLVYRDSSDEEKIRLFSQRKGAISVMGQTHRTHNEMNGY